MELVTLSHVAEKWNDVRRSCTFYVRSFQRTYNKRYLRLNWLMWILVAFLRYWEFRTWVLSSIVQTTPKAHRFSRALTLRLLMSYIYMEHLFLMFLDHTQRRTTVGRTPLDEWSASRRDLYLTTHDTHNRQICTPRWDLNPRSQQVSGLRPLTCWDRGFESHRGHGYLSVVSVMCCEVEVSAMSWWLVQRSPTDCGASLCVI